ncbi:hypothetical protein [Breoghania sp. L-A4]|uniref:hypothetical protein n=1 Tax=Breoghania sp. L-A4 TaxID=2304600 RepID=UPI0013C2B44B|nr:hypothetical protein [Breoghania sp. L-A4]
MSSGHVFSAERTLAPNAVRISFVSVEGDARFRQGIDTLAELVARPYAGGAMAP